MARVKSGTVTKNRHKKVLKRAKGYRGRSSKCFRVAIEKTEKGMQYAYRDRRNKKRTWRALWIARINAASRLSGLTYSEFMHGVKLAEIEIDRKILAQLAVESPETFAGIAEAAKKALEQAEKKAA